MRRRAAVLACAVVVVVSELALANPTSATRTLKAPLACDVVACPTPRDHTESCDAWADNPHWSELQVGSAQPAGVKVKARFKCTEAGVDQIQYDIFLFHCGKKPSAVEAKWVDTYQCKIVARNTDQGVINSPAAGYEYKNNLHATKAEPIVDGWYAGCVIAKFVQVEGDSVYSVQVQKPSPSPANCKQATRSCLLSTYA